MVKIGEYYNLGKELLVKSEAIIEEEDIFKTEMMILLEAIKKIEELETRIKILEEK